MNEEENTQQKNFKEIDRGSILKLKLTHHTKEVDLIENSNTFDIFIEKNKKIYCHGAFMRLLIRIRFRDILNFILDRNIRKNIRQGVLY